MREVCIPESIYIVVDDVGWWNGTDDSKNNGPYRSGMPRRHVTEDYAALYELGKALNMRLTAAFIAGEWDTGNLLRSVPNATKYGDQWDNIAFLDTEMETAGEYLRAARSYVDFAVHGLYHEYWENGKPTRAEFYKRNLHNPNDNKMRDRDIVKRHLDAYFEIMEKHGLAEGIQTFVPPAFVYYFSDSAEHLSAILAEYGIKYVSTPFVSMGAAEAAKPEKVCVENGIITADRTGDFIDWNVSDPVMPNTYKKSCFGMHWPNVLHPDPKQNLTVVGKWIAYFKKCGEAFDVTLSRSGPEAFSQMLYTKYAELMLEDNKVCINLQNAPQAKGLLKSLVINISNDCFPVENDTCKMTVLSEYEQHTSYLVSFNSPNVCFTCQDR